MAPWRAQVLGPLVEPYLAAKPLGAGPQERHPPPAIRRWPESLKAPLSPGLHWGTDGAGTRVQGSSALVEARWFRELEDRCPYATTARLCRVPNRKTS
jgi:hypothetical protein